MSTTEKTAVSTLAQWKKNKSHSVTLPSSSVVEIEIPDLPELIKSGVIPNELVDIAIGLAKGDREVTKEDIEKQADFYNKLVSIAVKSPEIKEEDVKSIPFEDKEMIVEFATRQRDLDVLGHHYAGLDKVEDFRTFRGLGPSLEALRSL
jgi:hypothetical protein